jgi:hypothetical protein
MVEGGCSETRRVGCLLEYFSCSTGVLVDIITPDEGKLSSVKNCLLRKCDVFRKVRCVWETSVILNFGYMISKS